LAKICTGLGKTMKGDNLELTQNGYAQTFPMQHRGY
jgi:hypothetical protein